MDDIKINILYVSRLCSEDKFNELLFNNLVKSQQQEQKFHSLLVKGLYSANANITSISVLPTIPSKGKSFLWETHEEKDDHVTYRYLYVNNILIIKHIIMFVWSLMASISWFKTRRNESNVIVCDVLNLSTTMGALLTSKILGVKIVAIITDMPNYMVNHSDNKKIQIDNFIYSIYKIICNHLMKKYDGYVILTEQMNELVNPNKKPYLVIEGMVDSNMVHRANEVSEKNHNKIVIYAGTLHEKYGVKKLLEAFMLLPLSNVGLWLYGSGDSVNDITEAEKSDNRVKYWGVVPNSTVVEAEIVATLLVNPRPSKEEFTKYSYPSKNMEYMVSGTPLLTTPLPGMPSEYNDHVYIIKDESVEGISKTLFQLLGRTKDELHEKGRIAKDFVLNYKNNITQARKILDLIDTMYKH
jgi:glycosyltransferase involved in cell wall biosynthesis